jgi:hypothetical protein
MGALRADQWVWRMAVMRDKLTEQTLVARMAD